MYLDNAPSYVAALYPPFVESLVVIAGRSLIAIPAEGPAIEYSYRPRPESQEGPGAPRRATFADLGPDKIGLWVTSESQMAGDGLFLLRDDWTLTAVNHNNNMTGLGRGSVAGATALYVSHLDMGTFFIDRLAATEQTTVRHLEEIPYIGDIAVVDNTLFVTVEMHERR